MDDYFTYLCERVISEIQAERPPLTTAVNINLDTYYEAMGLDYLEVMGEPEEQENGDQ